MNHSFSLPVLALVLLLSACQNEQPTTMPNTVTSPDETNRIDFILTEKGEPTYRVFHGEEMIIANSKMGFEFKAQTPFDDGFKIIGTQKNTVNEEWEMPWGEQRKVTNHCNELVVSLEEDDHRKRRLNIYFRAYDDGIGFRYEFLPQEGRDSIHIMDENTEFQLVGDHKAWWIPGDWDIYEHLYTTSRISQIDAMNKRDHPNLAQSYISSNSVNTPITMQTGSGLHLSFHEANLTDYAGMTLKVDNETFKLTSKLVASPQLGGKVQRALPFKTPWRTIQIAEKAGDLIESKLILNLNEPNKLGDVSWFKPMKYVGIWWELHLGKSTWDYGMTMDENGKWVDTGKAHGKHGATTENTKKYIDFAAANNIGGVLVEGWNTGWEKWIGFDDREGVFDFVTPYPDYDLEEVVKYAKAKGVEIIMHHETSAAPRTYEQQLDTAFQLMNRLGIHSVKTGYVGKITPIREYHHGQWMVNHYRKVLETAAAYQVAVNAHEPIKATGIRRTYPNAISREGLRGQEFNAWSVEGGNPPEHLPIVAFTRMLAGPIDFTPGIFNFKLKEKPESHVNTTLAQQLALYVVIYSPIQMACDLPEHYENQPGFQFIRDVGVDWEQSIVLNGEVGDFVTIAREERETGNWFVGGITDEKARELTVDFDFLEDGKTYEAIIYKDAANAHYRDNPTALDIEKIEVKKGMSQTIRLAEGGGFAMSLMVKR